MSQLTPQFSANRTVREYTEKYYLPLAAAYQTRSADNGKTGKQIVEWQNVLRQKWNGIQFGEVKAKTEGDKHIFEVQVYLKDLDPAAVVVELYADGKEGGTPVRQEFKLIQHEKVADKPHLYQAIVSATRPVNDFTPRIIPNFPGVSVPLETTQIIWQR
jgi:starch phosphorylase